MLSLTLILLIKWFHLTIRVGTWNRVVRAWATPQKIISRRRCYMSQKVRSVNHPSLTMQDLLFQASPTKSSSSFMVFLSKQQPVPAKTLNQAVYNLWSGCNGTNFFFHSIDINFQKASLGKIGKDEPSRCQSWLHCCASKISPRVESGGCKTLVWPNSIHRKNSNIKPNDLIQQLEFPAVFIWRSLEQTIFEASFKSSTV